MSDIDAILEGQEPEATPEQPAEEAPQGATEEAAEAPPPEAEAEPEASEIASEDAPEAPKVPLKALHEVRDENRDLKQRLANLEARQAPKVEQPKPPEFIDPEGATYLQQQVQQIQHNNALEMSQLRAEMRHGEDVVKTAFDAANQAGLAGQFAQQKDPWGALVNWHMQQQVVAEVGNDPVAYREKIAAEERAKIKAEMAVQQAKGAQPAPSMAGVTSATQTTAQPGSFQAASLDDLLS